MANEEISIRFSGDTSALGNALRGVKSMVSKAADGIKDSFKEAFKSLAAPLSIVGAVDGVRELFNGLMEDVKNIKRISESTGLDTGITQDILNLGKASGVASGEIEGMLDKFVKGLAPGSDPSDALYEIANKMASIEDPATRAALATEAFGKSGVKLIPVLKEGADGVKRLAEEYGKLDDAQIAQMDHADEVMDKAGHQAKIWLANRLEIASEWFKEQKKNPLQIPIISFLKSYTSTDISGEQPDVVTSKAKMTPAEQSKAKVDAGVAAAKVLAEKEEYYRAKPEEKVLIITRQILAVRREIEAASDEEKRAQLGEKVLDMEKSRAEISKGIAQKEKEREKEREQAAKAMQKLLDDMAAVQSSGQGAKKNENGANNYPTLEELARSGSNVFRHNQWEWQPGPFARTAQDVEALRQRQVRDREYGNEADAKWAEGQINSRMDYLRDNHALPPSEVMKDMDAKLAAISQSIEELNAASKGAGLKVTGDDN